MTETAIARELPPRRSLWFLMPIVLLGGLLTLLGVLIAIASSDAGFAVESDYYQKATRWDETMQERRASEQLGWSVRTTLRDTSQDTRIEVVLNDQSGRAIAAARVDVEAFPNARATEVHHLGLIEGAPGHYIGTLPYARRGLWEVRIDARGASGERFLNVSRVDVEVNQP
jgi:nitrogen fixation protein FixH